MTESDDDIVGRMNLEDHNRALLEENKRLRRGIDNAIKELASLSKGVQGVVRANLAVIRNNLEVAMEDDA